MRRASLFSRLVREQRGTTAVEFGLVCLVFVSMLLGVVDMGRLAWRINTAKAATREGVRLAVVSPIIATYMANYDGSATLGGGQVVPDMAFRCTGAGSTCTQIVGSGGSPGFDTTTFNAVLAKMQAYDPDIAAANVVITYRHVGLGKVGNPYAPDMEPLVTVSLTGVTFQSAALQIFGVQPFTLPATASTLSGESLS
ncbi:TadE-like protein [Caulobacter sp. AP07]|uniref:TadE/TadG family type IV pilus assembly protein n=1 Tax=Caulobacter sp. AP07 TaxID=1144304 RepID=UPI0002720C8B|nr:TadE/TadG family type IV pilus assembly protein [Caulobacter sp. AP07]EJL25247.1 TadE-like protein [Caulobacter sp. AP07]